MRQQSSLPHLSRIPFWDSSGPATKINHLQLIVIGKKGLDHGQIKLCISSKQLDNYLVAFLQVLPLL
jgi:hypothetical protein